MGFQPVLYLLLQTASNRQSDCTGWKLMRLGQTPRLCEGRGFHRAFLDGSRFFAARGLLQNVVGDRR